MVTLVDRFHRPGRAAGVIAAIVLALHFGAVTQTYEGGEVVEWAGPEGSDTPASITLVKATGEGGWPASAWLAFAALALGLALGVALRLGKARPTHQIG